MYGNEACLRAIDGCVKVLSADGSVDVITCLSITQNLRVQVRGGRSYGAL